MVCPPRPSLLMLYDIISYLRYLLRCNFFLSRGCAPTNLHMRCCGCPWLPAITSSAVLLHNCWRCRCCSSCCTWEKEPNNTYKEMVKEIARSAHTYILKDLFPLLVRHTLFVKEPRIVCRDSCSQWLVSLSQTNGWPRATACLVCIIWHIRRALLL